MIYVGENKSILCKGEYYPAQLYKGEKKIAGYTVRGFEGTGSIMLEKCYNDKLYDVFIGEDVQSISVRGKNYFDINKIPFTNTTTTPYGNGLKTKKVNSANRGNQIPISLPVGKRIYITMDVVDSQIEGTAKQITMGFYNSEKTRVWSTNISSAIAKKSYSFTLTEEIAYIQFYFQSNNSSNAVGDYVTMDNIMLRCEGDDTYEPYIKPQAILLENGELREDIPTFKGTTIIEIESDVAATIRGKYKKQEE